MTSSLEATTRALAQAHFPEAFEEGSPWKVSKVYAREEAELARCVLKLVGPGVAYAFKHEKAPSHRARFAKIFEHQKDAFQRFPLVAGMALAEPIRVDAKHQCAIFRYIEGQNLRDHLTFFCPTRTLQLEMVERAGAWLDHFHRSSSEGHRKFYPISVKNSYLDLRNDVEAGRLHVPETSLFTACIDRLEQLAPELRGQKTAFASPHKDFHAGNLIWDGTTLTGIDLGAGAAAPVGQDINKFLIDFVRRFCSADELSPGQLYPEDVVEAFFAGYKLVGQDDPSVQLYAWGQIAEDWKLIPADKLQRSQGKQECLTQLRAIAKHTLADRNQRPPLRVLLSQALLKPQRDGKFGFIPVLRKAARRRGFVTSIGEDSAGARKLAERAGVHTLLYDAKPLGGQSLTFQRQYAEPFWHVSPTAMRWKSQAAKARFKSGPSEEAERFFDHWAERLHGIQNESVRDDGFVYMPLQNKLLTQRGFQSMSPAEMIQTTLSQTSLPIRATLDPETTYAPAELDLLKEISALSTRFSVVELPMQDALATCRYVVTQNSDAGFHALFYRKPVVLFAEADFHHICLNVGEIGAKAAFEKLPEHRPDVASYLYWFWGQHAVNIEDANAGALLAKHLKKLGF